MKELTLSDFQYELPEEAVAHHPLAERTQAKLLVRTAQNHLQHSNVYDITKHIPAGSVLILNESRVIPSRLFGTLSSGGRVEIFLLELHDDQESTCEWLALGRPMKKLHLGRVIQFTESLMGEVTGRVNEDGDQPCVRIRFNCNFSTLTASLEGIGYIPLPPYIKRQNPLPASKSHDTLSYQTVYAKDKGSVAAPTAGLHFSVELLQKIKSAGIDIVPVLLHVGGGTFLPVKTERLDHHQMHHEKYYIAKESMKKLLAAKQEGRHIISVGTTSFRAVESLCLEALANGKDPQALTDMWRDTGLFIFPRFQNDRYQPQLCDAIMTNFHQPGSTLFMLISALIGVDEAKKLYRTAIAEGYRLFSYGDTSLLWLS